MPQSRVCKCCQRDGDPSHLKDSAWAWMVCFGAATNMAFTTGLIFCFGVLLPVFMDYFKESRQRVAWIGSLSIAICQCCGPLAGSLVNRFGCRKVSITGCLICAVSLTAASFANNLVILYVFYGVFGVGAAGVFVSGLEIVRKSFDKRQSIALGIVGAGQGAGTTVLSQVLQSLVAAVRWRTILRIFSGALFLNSFIGILYDSKIESTSINELLSSGEAGQRRTSKRFTFHFSLWKVPSFLVVAASFFFIMFGRSIIYLLLVKYSADNNVSSDTSTRLILFMGINIVIGRLSCGVLCSFNLLNNWYILQAVLLVNGISTNLLTLAHNYAALVAYAVVFGFFDGAMITVLGIQILTCVDNTKAASALGFTMVIGSVTSLTGPPIAGLTVDKLGSYGPAFHMAGGALLAASLIPFALHYVKAWRVQSSDFLPTDGEHTEDAQEPEQWSYCSEHLTDETLKTTYHSYDRKQGEVDHRLFLSTV